MSSTLHRSQICKNKRPRKISYSKEGTRSQTKSSLRCNLLKIVKSAVFLKKRKKDQRDFLSKIMTIIKAYKMVCRRRYTIQRNSMMKLCLTRKLWKLRTKRNFKFKPGGYKIRVIERFLTSQTCRLASRCLLKIKRNKVRRFKSLVQNSRYKRQS